MANFYESTSKSIDAVVPLAMKLEEIKRSRSVESAKHQLAVSKLLHDVGVARDTARARDIGNTLKAIDTTVKMGGEPTEELLKKAGIGVPYEDVSAGRLSIPAQGTEGPEEDPRAALMAQLDPAAMQSGAARLGAERLEAGPDGQENYVADLTMRQRKKMVPLDMQKAQLTQGAADARAELAAKSRVDAAKVTQGSAAERQERLISATNERAAADRSQRGFLANMQEEGRNKRAAAAAQNARVIADLRKSGTPSSVRLAGAFDSGKAQLFSQLAPEVNNGNDPVIANVDRSGEMVLYRFPSIEKKRQFQQAIRSRDQGGWVKLRDEWVKKGWMTRASRAGAKADDTTYDAGDNEE